MGHIVSMGTADRQISPPIYFPPYAFCLQAVPWCLNWSKWTERGGLFKKNYGKYQFCKPFPMFNCWHCAESYRISGTYFFPFISGQGMPHESLLKSTFENYWEYCGRNSMDSQWHFAGKYCLGYIFSVYRHQTTTTHLGHGPQMSPWKVLGNTTAGILRHLPRTNWWNTAIRDIFPHLSQFACAPTDLPRKTLGNTKAGIPQALRCLTNTSKAPRDTHMEYMTWSHTG